MKLFRSRDLPGRWVGEDQDGALVHWPAEPSGWQRRTPYTGARRPLEEVEPALARGTGWPGGGRGRPPRAASPAKNFGIRATVHEVAHWTATAAREGKQPSVWARDTLNGEAARSGEAPHTVDQMIEDLRREFDRNPALRARAAELVREQRASGTAPRLTPRWPAGSKK